MNPWTETAIALCRNAMRFAVWVCLATCGVMLGLFLVVFTLRFLYHLYTWCERVMFTGSW